ncbi:MAG: peptidase caspase catalytic subunit p20 [Bryobacterales bacterium]|nr:peptidase caspase catalytic subunit p20 [Bryobacterales bacterium]
MTTANIDRLGSRSFPGAVAASARDFSATDLAALRPYVVSMRQGHWDTGGIFNSTPGDVDALFFEHAKSAIEGLANGKKLKFVLYAHGGLVSEQSGLEQAQFHINWWKQSAADGIYPIYFIWKTGLGETIAQVLGLAGGAARDLAGAPREWVSDPIVAAIARRLGGEGLWSGMKRDAEQAVMPDGAATYVAQKLKEFCDLYPDRVELHAVGHSAGAVFHSHFIPLSTVKKNPYFTTTSLLAPAVRVDTFMDQLTMDDRHGGRVIKPEVGHLAIFTMKKDFEKRDNCVNIYHQSLLYLIYHAFEPVNPTPILGLEESLRGNSQLAALMGLGGASARNAEVIWSTTATTSGCSATEAIHHGDFSSDAPTFNSILRRILKRCNDEPIHPFPSGARELQDMWDIWAPPTDLPGFTVAAGGQSEPPPAATVTTPPVKATTNSGARRALCVAIDAYASPNRLTGCVHDAHTWATVLSGKGFETRLLLDRDATYDRITAALREMVQSSRAGDVLVFQYSGHGTTVPDSTGRTVDGIEEAMVPVDFNVDTPKLLMDFDVAAIFTALPAGVNLTCFIDCCHSGTITRMFVGLAPQAGDPAADERPRFITLSAEEIAAVQQYRAGFAATARGVTLGGQDRMRDIVFAACQPDEVAWEVNGQGEFTRLATGLLASSGSMSHDQFQNAVVQAFGSAPRQHPVLDCAVQVKSRVLLQPA